MDIDDVKIGIGFGYAMGYLINFNLKNNFRKVLNLMTNNRINLCICLLDHISEFSTISSEIQT